MFVIHDWEKTLNNPLSKQLQINFILIQLSDQSLEL